MSACSNEALPIASVQAPWGIAYVMCSRSIVKQSRNSPSHPSPARSARSYSWVAVVDRSQSSTQYEDTDSGDGTISEQAETQPGRRQLEHLRSRYATTRAEMPTPRQRRRSTPTPVEDTQTTPVEDTGPEPVEDTSEPEPEPEDVEDPVILCGNGTCDPKENCTSVRKTVRVSAGSGRLLITEIMQNPKALSDDTGEWIESYW